MLNYVSRHEPDGSFPRRAASILATLGCLLLILCGCSGDPAPAPAATATPVVESQNSPTSVAVADGVAAPPVQPTDTAEPTATPQPSATPTTDPGKPLEGRRIGLDPGHGPRKDLGAVLVDPNTKKLILSEDELDLDVAKRCRDILVARGARVTMTRETKDSFTAPWPPDTNGDGIEQGVSDDLQERIDILNASHAEVFLSIHANSAGDPAKRGGMQALYCGTDDCLYPKENKRLGQIVLDHLQAALEANGVPIKKRELRSDYWSDTPGVAPTHLFMTGPANPPHHPRAIQMPGITIEALYVTSPDEATQLKRDSIRQAIAVAYADALQEFLTGKK
jgi:N-acetylmuramoyl-L-alanine amidase